MKQVLPIFRKDCRRFWPEILAMFLLNAAFVWLTPHRWLLDQAEGAHPFRLLDFRHVEILANTLTALVPLSWLVLITRVIHDENLVSERSFWLTRPYDWRKLLAPKVLFVICFVFGPLLAGQIILLRLVGFSPTQHIAGLAFGMVLFASAILPMLAFAAVMSSLLRVILTLLGAAVLTVAAAFVASTLDLPSTLVPGSDPLSTPLLITVCAAAIVLQYATRRVWLSRGLLLASIATILLMVGGLFDEWGISHIYNATGPSSLVLQYIPADEGAITTLPKDDKFVSLTIPMEAIGIGDHAAFTPDNLRVTLTAQDGSIWSSPWTASYNEHLMSDQPQTRLNVDVDPAFLKKLVTGPLPFRSRWR